VEEAEAAAIEDGAVTRRGEFLWPSGMTEPPIRDRSHAGPRDAALLPPEELAAALRLVIAKELRIAREDLVKRAAQLLGYSRTGARLQRTFHAALDRLIEEGAAAEVAGVVTPPETS
jgi:hypothetical protein